ncbi:hypothetical protein [Paraurantiacibacter namhicola]|uniref:Uncharacterized protein n=1 Tax=Paraurantiacibacter namhicola TaxID=645517 RepID=A0A1C7DB16_9SPHN|nr:hypothetical protein [Paraurantiacibacter namhicola]ANU08572.1 hypothetical protein A6F65_02289 [Paraurantiacibacter namhicola]
MNTEAKKSKTGKTIFALVLGGLAGFFAAMGMMQLVESGTLGDLSASREVALLVALIYGLTAAAVLVGLLNPAIGAKFLNVEDAEELREQRGMLGWSGAAMLCWAGTLAVLALGGEGFPIPSVTAAAIVGGLMLVSILATAKQWHLTDELMRALSRESTALAFYLLAGIGGGWAALAHLDLVSGPAMLDWLTMAAAFILIAVFWKAGRRGMLEMR